MFVTSLFKGKFADGITILKNAKKILTTKQSSKVQYIDVWARFTVVRCITTMYVCIML